MHGDRKRNYVAFNKNGRPMILTSSLHGRFFSLKSSVAAAVWNDDIHLQVVGYRSETVVANFTYVLQVVTTSTLNFSGYTKLDKAVLKISAGHRNPDVDRSSQEFAMDNICVEFD